MVLQIGLPILRIVLFALWNLFIRRHHCRLCGSVVCDDPNGTRKGCSMNVPLVKLVEKLPQLNYHTRVRGNR